MIYHSLAIPNSSSTVGLSSMYVACSYISLILLDKLVSYLEQLTHLLLIYV